MTHCLKQAEKGALVVFRETRPTRSGTVLDFGESDYKKGLMVYFVKTSEGIAEVEPQDIFGEVGK